MNEIVINLRSEKIIKRLLRKDLIVNEYRKQGFLFGLEVWHNIWRMQEKEPDKFKDISEADYIILLYFLAADNYQKEKRAETDFTQEDVKGWIAKMTQSEANSIGQCFADSQIIGKKVSDLIFSGKEEKKK